MTILCSRMERRFLIRVLSNKDHNDWERRKLRQYTYSQIHISNRGAVGQEHFNGTGMPGPSRQMKGTGTFIICRVATGFIAQKQLDNITAIREKQKVMHPLTLWIKTWDLLKSAQQKRHFFWLPLKGLRYFFFRQKLAKKAKNSKY